MQLGDASVIAERTSATVIYDFRRRISPRAARAPLVPFADRPAADPLAPRALLNLGGIANVTLMGPGGAPLLAFDTGPANMVIDRFVERMTQGAARFDRDGAIAASGRSYEDGFRQT
jgi:anhydro-N-acetylmuramic acid kinase